nr:hypothetical protein 7 [Chromatiales bacterium]
MASKAKCNRFLFTTSPDILLRATSATDMIGKIIIDIWYKLREATRSAILTDELITKLPLLYTEAAITNNIDNDIVTESNL